MTHPLPTLRLPAWRLCVCRGLHSFFAEGKLSHERATAAEYIAMARQPRCFAGEHVFSAAHRLVGRTLILYQQVSLWACRDLLRAWINFIGMATRADSRCAL